jgi:hypothetical protein
MDDPIPHAVQDCLDDEVGIIERCRALGADRKSLAPFVEFPAVKSIAEAKAYAGVIFQILRVPRDSIRFEIFRRPSDRETHFFGDADGDHVSLDELAELNAGVVFAGAEIDGVIGSGYLQDNLRIGASKLSQPWQNHHLRRRSRNDESNSASRFLPLLPGLRYRSLDPLQSECEVPKQRRTCRRRGDTRPSNPRSQRTSVSVRHPIKHKEDQKFEAELSNQIWQADMFGPWVHRPSGGRMQAFLHATLDDASRLIRDAQFYAGQGLDFCLDCLRHAVASRGLGFAAYERDALWWQQSSPRSTRHAGVVAGCCTSTGSPVIPPAGAREPRPTYAEGTTAT